MGFLQDLGQGMDKPCHALLLITPAVVPSLCNCMQAGTVMESGARTWHAHRLPAVAWALTYSGIGPGAIDSPEGASTMLRTVEVYGACVSAGAGAKPRTTVPAGQSSTCDSCAGGMAALSCSGLVTQAQKQDSCSPFRLPLVMRPSTYV